MIQFYRIQQFWPHNQCSPYHKVIALGLAQFALLLHCGGGGARPFWDWVLLLLHYCVFPTFVALINIGHWTRAQLRLPSLSRAANHLFERLPPWPARKSNVWKYFLIDWVINIRNYLATVADLATERVPLLLLKPLPLSHADPAASF